MYMFIYVYVYIYIYMYACEYIYIYIYIYIFFQCQLFVQIPIYNTCKTHRLMTVHCSQRLVLSIEIILSSIIGQFCLPSEAVIFTECNVD